MPLSRVQLKLNQEFEVNDSFDIIRKPKGFLVLICVLLLFIVLILLYLMIARIVELNRGNGVDVDYFVASWILIVILILLKFIHGLAKINFVSEWVNIDDEILTIEKRIFGITIFKKKIPLDAVKSLYISDKSNRTSHALATGSFDYLGIETSDKEVDYLTNSQKIVLDINNKKRNIGIGLFPEELELIYSILKKYI